MTSTATGSAVSDSRMAGRVIVGVDPSDEARGALRWAMHYGALTGSSIEVVHGWQVTHEYVWVNTVPVPDDPTETARRAIEEMVSQARDETGLGADRVTVEVHVIEGPAVKTILDRSEDAALLVLGSRGHGGFAGLLLGTVSTQCTTHARCSVTIVRPDSKRPDA